MQTIMYNIEDKFFEDPIEYLEYECDMDIDVLKEEPDDFVLTALECDTESLVTLSAEWITTRIDDERFSENGVDDEIGRIYKALEKHIDFEALNKEIPKMWYPSRRKITWTKQELIEIWT